MILLKYLLLGLIRLYQLTFSYFLGRQCRFLPTCSAYAAEAIQLHGPVRGSQLAFRRICRCGPCGGNGYDPVPLSFPQCLDKQA